MPVGVAEGVDGGTERLVGVLVDVDQPGQGGGDTEVEPMTLGVERVGDRLFDVVATWRSVNRAAAAGSMLRRPPHGRLAVGVCALGGAGLGSGQEALEVTESVAAVASRVDPVVAQPAGVAPGTDRVRMHAKQPGGLGDR